MTLRAWRIVKSVHAATAFSGEAAKQYGGRWNSHGSAVIYTASSISLAMLEILVHIRRDQLLRHYVLFGVEFADDLVESLEAKTLPPSWRNYPAPAATQQVGDRWLVASKFAVLRVPSVIVPDESNYLLSPAHPDFKKILIGPAEPIEFDPRLLR